MASKKRQKMEDDDQVESNVKGTSNAKMESDSKDSKGWTRQQRVIVFETLVGKPSPAVLAQAAKLTGKTPAQCYDLWRKTLHKKIVDSILNGPC
ncbi:unnamed protein product [Parajaminaea phylloscopi]